MLADREGKVAAVNFLGPSRSAFDSDDWKTNTTCRCTPVRQRMAPDLVSGNRLGDRTREEVVDLLGPADRDPYLLEEQPRWQRSLVYVLGMDHLGLDHEWLVIQLDETDHVKQALIVCD